ncbi:PQQ-dependent sugar dehydrogenase [Saccharopolyspora rosea]|uniref:PQQ-dependent sugar dehydrogenase n=1 Tax=Saccharopolyspora rosea TaxID=524884 RepID=A0ABW3FV35_9PSEU
MAATFRRLAFGAAVAVGALLAGCAQFPDEHQRPWADQPSLEPQAGPQPSIEGETPPPQTGAPKPQKPAAPVGCEDPDPAVVATCLDPVGAIAVLPDGQGALVGERATGRILRVQRGAQPRELARVPVDPSGDGGLTGLALSPSYGEDELFYAYVTAPGGNEVVRIAPGDRPKPVLTGIPRGASGNSGALLDDGKGALLVATGNAGDPADAANPASLAGKVLRVDGFGNPAPGNPDPTSRVVASGLAEPGGLCGAPGAGTYWVTDRGGSQDALYQVQPGRPLGAPSWTWREKPGVAGCAAAQSAVVVALRGVPALFTLHPGPDGTITGQPTRVMENTYGRFSAAALGPDGLLWLGTSNKAGGRPVSSDDRALRIEPPTGGAAGKD